VIPDPAIALIEFSSVAVGTRALDALLKKAPVRLERAGTVQPGKFVMLFAGAVAAVEESFAEACRLAADSLIDRVLLSDVHETVAAAVLGTRGNWRADTLGIIETPTMAAVIDAADAAVKGARVEVVEIRLGDGLGGRGLAHFCGEQADVEAAIHIGSERAARHGQEIRTTIIPRADETMLEFKGRSTRFADGW